MDDRGVTDELCAARMATVTQALATIAKDGAEAREGIGKLIHVVCEGNGHEALTVTVNRNTAWIADRCKEAQDRRKEKLTVRLALVLAFGGWAFTAVLWVLSRFVPSA